MTCYILLRHKQKHNNEQLKSKKAGASECDDHENENAMKSLPVLIFVAMIILISNKYAPNDYLENL